VQICYEAGLPPGIVNMLKADRTVPESLVRHPGVNKIAFTGSTGARRRDEPGPARHRRHSRALQPARPRDQHRRPRALQHSSYITAQSIACDGGMSHMMFAKPMGNLVERTANDELRVGSHRTGDLLRIAYIDRHSDVAALCERLTYPPCNLPADTEYRNVFHVLFWHPI